MPNTIDSFIERFAVNTLQMGSNAILISPGKMTVNYQDRTSSYPVEWKSPGSVHKDIYELGKGDNIDVKIAETADYIIKKLFNYFVEATFKKNQISAKPLYGIHVETVAEVLNQGKGIVSPNEVGQIIFGKATSRPEYSAKDIFKVGAARGLTERQVIDKIIIYARSKN